MIGQGRGILWKAWPDRRIKSFDQPETVWELLWDGTSRGEPGARWLPSWFLGERNRYVPRPDVQDDVLRAFATRQSDGSTPRLVTLQGYGGMGKTRLAITCATQVAGRFEHGVFFVPLDATLRSQDALAAAIGSALGMAGEPISPSNLIIALRDKEILLLLDNYEAIDGDTVRLYLAERLSQTSRLHLLVTGREAVKLSDVEQLIDLDTGMTEQEAVALFVARAQLKRRSWQPTSSEVEVLQKILTLTECVPLAIELVAAWTDKRTLTEIAEGLEATSLGVMTDDR